MRVTARKLYLAYDADALLHGLLHHGSIARYARTLYYLVGIKDLLLGVMQFLPLYAVAVEQLLVLVLYGRHVAYEHVETLFLCQDCGTGSTLAGTKNYHSFHCFLF